MLASNVLRARSAKLFCLDATNQAITRTRRIFFGLALNLCGCVTLVTPTYLSAETASPIPHGQVATGTLDIRRTWLAGPTMRYPHEVLGDAIEASVLVVETASGRTLSAKLDDDSVFEDVTPRIADVDDDGHAEVWTVRSDARDGARLEAYVLSGAGAETSLKRRYATTPIGIGFRWLNPIGVADFDGDGQQEIAYIETPHIGGILTVVHPNRSDPSDPMLRVVARSDGFSNHAMGSPHLDLATTGNVDGILGDEIVVLGNRRSTLFIVSVVGDQIVERWRTELPERVGRHLRLNGLTPTVSVTYVSTSGTTHRIPIPTSALRPRQ